MNISEHPGAIFALCCFCHFVSKLGETLLVDIRGVVLPSYLSMFLKKQDECSNRKEKMEPVQLCYGEDPLSTRVMRL